MNPRAAASQVQEPTILSDKINFIAAFNIKMC